MRNFFPLAKTTVGNNVLCTTVFHLLPNISLFKNLERNIEHESHSLFTSLNFFQISSFTRGVLMCEQKVPNKLNFQKLDYKQLKRSV